MMQQILELLQIHHLKTTPYHAKCDGAAERAIHTANSVLSHFVTEDQKNWCDCEPFIEWMLNTMKNETTGYSAFELMFGRTPLRPLDVTMGFDGLTEMSYPSAIVWQQPTGLRKPEKSPKRRSIKPMTSRHHD
jgi:hypothetical protein